MSTIQLQVLTGARSGFALSASGEEGEILIGRHSDAKLQFHPEHDLQVSAFHAILTQQGNLWVLEDLRSRNGTYINGVELSAATPVRSGDRITFGRGGPEVEVRISAQPVAGIGSPAAAAPMVPLVQAAGSASTGKGATKERLRVEVHRQTRRLRWIAGGSVVVLMAATGAFLFTTRQQKVGSATERAYLQQRIDSLLAAGQVTERSLTGLENVLRESQAELQRLRGELARAVSRKDTAGVPALRRRLEATATTLNRQQRAASLDFREIEAANRPAIAVVYVESSDGTVSTATAFAVRPDATFLTARHAVVGASGSERPKRIAIQFSDSEQIWPARLVATSNDADLAVIKVDNIMGSVPTVRGFGASGVAVQVGMPVAMIGFPRGGQGGISEGKVVRVVKPTLSTGVVESVTDANLEIVGYGTVGASGSPIFNAEGRVVGVLYGGRERGGSHSVVATPVATAARLLGNLPR